MAEYDNPRPSSQPVGSTDLATAKDNLITFDTMINAVSGQSITNRKGEAVTPIVDIVDGAQSLVNQAVLQVGWVNQGEFSTLPTMTNANDVAVFEGNFWVTTEPLPYTPTGTSPLSAPEDGKWVVAVTAELLGIARSLNTLNSNVMYEDSANPIVSYIYSQSQQVIYSVPAAATGKTISSVVGSTLNTTEPASYQLESINRSGVEFATIADVDNLTSVGGALSNLLIGDSITVLDYAQGNNSGVLFFSVVPGGTGVADGGTYIDLPSLGLQLKQNMKVVPAIKDFGAVGDGVTDDSGAIQTALNSGFSRIISNPGCTFSFESRVTIPSNITVDGYNSEWKASATNTSGNGKIIGITAGVSNVSINGLTFNGNRSGGQSDLSPLTQLFNCSLISINECEFANCGGIANNISNAVTDVKITRCKYEDIGFTDGVGGANAKQAIAFSSGGHENICLTYNSFKSIGLDCMSIGGITTGNITGNYHADNNCYTLIYNGEISRNLTIDGNIAMTAVNSAGSSRPQGLGIDLPKLVECTVANNICSGCASGGLAIFSGATQVSVTGNVCTDNNQSGESIHDAGLIVRLTSGPVILENNISVNRLGSTQSSGLLFDYAQAHDIKIGRNNTFGGANEEVKAATFASETDVGTTIYNYQLPLDVDVFGSPEGVLAAPVGSVARRLDGGTGTSLYIKESGTGSAGWIAK